MGWGGMNITQSLKDHILKSFSSRGFTVLDLPVLSKKFGRDVVRNKLIEFKRTGFLKSEDKWQSHIGNLPPLNIYHVAFVTSCEHKPGDVTVWHPANQPPVNKCNRVQFYEVLDFGGDINCYRWNGSWPIPTPWVKGWRGVTR